MDLGIATFVIIHNSIKILSDQISYIASSTIRNYIKSFHIDLNMLDHQFISIACNCIQIMMEIGKEVATCNLKIA